MADHPAPLPPPVPPAPVGSGGAPPSRTARSKRWLAGGAAVLGAAGAIAIAPVIVDAQDDDGDGGWVADALQELVDDGTLTADQADAVEQALDDARPEPGDGDWAGHHGPWGRGPILVALDAAADAIGIEVDELRQALADGQTLAEVAEANGVDAQTVIDALVAEVQQRLDDAVADGRIDATDEADRLAEATDRITDLVEEGFPAGPHGEWGDGHWGPGGPWHHDERVEPGDETTDDSTPDASPDTTTPDTGGS